MPAGLRPDKNRVRTDPDDRVWPPLNILAFTRKELTLFHDRLPGGRRRSGLLSGLTQLTTWPKLALAGPIIGAPQAAMVLEILSRRGARTFLSLGWCGALQPGLTWGRIVLPTGALSDEGTSAHYQVPDYQPAPDPILSAGLVAGLEARGLGYTTGRVWTTDAPYRETRTLVSARAAQGLVAVDMESSALMTVARFRELAWAGLMVVSDELWTEKWRPGFDSAELEAGLVQAVEVILALAAKLGET